MSMAWLFLCPLASILLLFLLPTSSLAQAPYQHECPKNCGDVDIPYPFGIGRGCALNARFELNCTMTDNGSYKPFFSNVELLNISLPLGQARIKNRISWQCFNSINRNISSNNWYLNLTKGPFRFSNFKNKFTAIGSETLAYVYLKNNTSIWFRTGCVSVCLSLQGLVNGSCSGIGCCQTAIPSGMNYYSVSFDKNFNSSDVSSFSRCSYAVLMEAESFTFSTSYVTTYDFWENNKGQVPLVVDWAIGNETCKVAQRNQTSYACVSSHSTCIDSTNGPGYICNCDKGYQGNPYLYGGCKDIDECQNKSTCSGICTNTPGSFICSCPRGKHGNGNSTGVCYNDAGVPLWVKIVIGICACVVVALMFLSLLFLILERRKIAVIKEKYFQEYGGQLLSREMKLKEVFAFTIFKEEELKEATKNFDEKHVIGQGGNGMVYKALINNEHVAIKRCKTIDERQKKEFGKEILILSQINHKNIVRIVGCCLEVEIPILVYEYVPNGTLFDLIHANHPRSVPISARLRIAQEAAEALAYLHSWASPPIVHRDVKSSNILLDENYTAKVSDFGASVLTPMDNNQFLTLVQGTRGYLDPEYMQTGQLTVKSDVYSFGVVLVELLTCKKAFYLDEAGERCLSSAFLSAMKENKLEEILDDQIVLDEESMNLVNGAAELAKDCLNMEGEKRPEMREIAEGLDKLRKTIKHPWMQDNHDEIKCLLSEPSNNQIEMSSYYSLEEKAMLSMEYGR